MRAIIVWALSVAVNYFWEDSGGGERLTRMSGIQGLGFAIMVIGSFVFNRILRLPECGDEAHNAIQEALLTEAQGEPPEPPGPTETDPLGTVG
jgi:hypothetical protein